MTSRQATILKIVVGAVVGLAGPILVYLQARAELREKYAHSDYEAEAGYATLAKSVTELRDTVKAQSDTIARLQGHIESIEASMRRDMRLTVPHPALAPVQRPAFNPLPPDLDAAAK